MQLLSTLFMLLVSMICFSQEIPKDYFRNPLDIEPILSGTFAELRSNHFHSGVDIKTQQREGLKVYATASGYVARIKISPWGYGKAIYIKHPNGYTTVYAHLKKFAPEIEAYIKKKQYEKERFAIELFPDKSELTITKSDLIAYSGNTGGSGGPHLHYEIRDVNQHPMNPMLFGFKVKDTRKPTVKGLFTYSLNDSSQVEHHNDRYKIKLTQTKDGNYIANTIHAYGVIGFGINTIDQQDLAYNKNGVYNIKSFINGNPSYELDFSKFSFSETRYLNRLIDYSYYKNHKSRIQKLYQEPNNPLSIVKNVNEKGTVILKEGDHINYIIKIADFKGNIRTITIPLEGKKMEITHFKEKTNSQHYVYANKGLYLDNEHKSVYIPKGALYDDQALTFETIGDTIIIGKEDVPLHKNITLSFYADKFKNTDISKLYISKIGYNNLPYQYVSTYKKDQKISGKTKSFGKFAVSIDSIGPKITPINLYKGKWMSKSNYLQIKIADKLTGIKKYRATINGKWILMEYDPKKKMLTYNFNDKVVTTAEHNLKVIVLDNVGNSSTFETTFYRKY